MTEITDARIDAAIENLDVVRNRFVGNMPATLGDAIVEDAGLFALEIRRLRKREEDARGEKDAVYLERNRLVAFIARLFPSGIAKTHIPDWDEEWHNCVFIDLPTGQVSWHYHDDHSFLFEGLPEYEWPWDGHTTEEKYKRIAPDCALAAWLKGE